MKLERDARRLVSGSPNWQPIGCRLVTNRAARLAGRGKAQRDGFLSTSADRVSLGAGNSSGGGPTIFIYRPRNALAALGKAPLERWKPGTRAGATIRNTGWGAILSPEELQASQYGFQPAHILLHCR